MLIVVKHANKCTDGKFNTRAHIELCPLRGNEKPTRAALSIKRKRTNI